MLDDHKKVVVVCKKCGAAMEMLVSARTRLDSAEVGLCWACSLKRIEMLQAWAESRLGDMSMCGVRVCDSCDAVSSCTYVEGEWKCYRCIEERIVGLEIDVESKVGDDPSVSSEFENEVISSCESQIKAEQEVDGPCSHGRTNGSQCHHCRGRSGPRFVPPYGEEQSEMTSSTEGPVSKAFGEVSGVSWMKSDDRPARNGWVPGNYVNKTCVGCDEKFIGGKGTVRCADCAYKEDGDGTDRPD